MKTKKFQPTGDIVFVKQEEASETTEGGIVMPQGSLVKPDRGVVVAVGPGLLDDQNRRVPLEMKEGDKVAWIHGSATKLEIDGQELAVFHANGIIAIER